MSFTVNDLRMKYHMDTGFDVNFTEEELYDEEGEIFDMNGITCVDTKYFDWLEEQATNLHGKLKELTEIITRLTK